MDMWLLLGLMSLAVYRLTRLVVADTFPPVLWVRDRLVGGQRSPTRAEVYHDGFPGDVEYGEHRAVRGMRGLWTRTEDGEVVVFISHTRWSPHWLAELLSCPYCTSGWVAVAVTGGVWVWLGLAAPVVVLLWLATWALGGLLAAQEWA